MWGGLEHNRSRAVLGVAFLETSVQCLLIKGAANCRTWLIALLCVSGRYFSLILQAVKTAPMSLGSDFMPHLHIPLVKEEICYYTVEGKIG